MRLTPEMVLEGDQGLNCLGDRELCLRNLAIPVIENLALAKDGFTTIDMTSNMITMLGDGFPPFPRLKTLYLSQNRIERIEAGLADSLPNLTTLILTSNRIATIQSLNLDELSKLTQLEVLSILDNPVAPNPQLRDMLIKALPKLKVLNFSKISDDERKSVVGTTGTDNAMKHANGGGKRKRSEKGSAKQSHNGGNKAIHDGIDGDGVSDGASQAPIVKKRKKLSIEESNALKAFIENSQSMNDITRVQDALRSGTVTQFLSSLNREKQENSK